MAPCLSQARPSLARHGPDPESGTAGPSCRTVAGSLEPFEPSTVTGRDVDRGIDAEPTVGLPSEHVIGDVTFEQALAVEVTEHSVAHGVLEFAPVGWGEMRGLVELDRALGILAEHAGRQVRRAIRRRGPLA